MKCEIDSHNGTLAYLEQNSHSGYHQVSSRSPAITIIIHVSEAFEWFLGNPLRLLCPLSNAIAGNLEITWPYLLSEFCSKQARVSQCKLTLHFSMGLNGSL